jgi:hypothetical protein
VRVVTLGTSISRGYWVPYADSFSGRLEQDLSRSCGRPVQFQNISVGVAQPHAWHTVTQKVATALGLDPDAIVLVVSNFDLEQYTQTSPEEPTANTPSPAHALTSTLGELRTLFADDSRAMTVAMHFAFSDPNRYLRFFSQHGDSADYLRPPLSAAWRFRLEKVDETVASIAAAAQTAHVPLLLMRAPPRPAVLLAHAPAAFPKLDEQVLPTALAGIARQHGAIYVDSTALESSAPNWNKLYFVADGHPNAEGHRFMAAALRHALVENVAPLRACK